MLKSKKQMIWAKNEKAFFDYEVLEKFEAGLSLRGFEVKAIKAGKAVINGARILIRGGEAFLVGATIGLYQPQNPPLDYSPDRAIKVLLKKKEIQWLSEQNNQRGLTIVPIKIYNQKNKIKAEVALVRGRKKRDKRETIKKREAERQIRRTLKNQWG